MMTHHPGRSARMLLGAAFWIALMAGSIWVLAASRGEGGSTSGLIARHFLRRPSHLEVKLPYPVLIEVGDEVHLADASGEVSEGARPAGEIEAILDGYGRELPSIYDDALA